MLLFTVPERKTNCTQNKNWALQDVVTVWQKPTYWLPAKPDQGDLTQKGCLFFFFFWETWLTQQHEFLTAAGLGVTYQTLYTVGLL